MSEYQLYQWIALDRPLSPREQKKVSRLSSHIEVSPWHATVEYHWSDFKHDPIKVLVKYFDVFLYWSNWGSRRLAIRLPKQGLDAEQFQPYLTEAVIQLVPKEECYIFDVSLEEETEEEVWISAGTISALGQLRNELLEGDYRVLYLAWLAGACFEEIDEDQQEPPVPPGLEELSPALKCFAKLFLVDKYLIAAAAEASPPLQPALPIPPEEAVGRLPPEERDDFLVRLLRGEPQLRQTLRRRLEELAGQPPRNAAPGRRMWGQLRDRADQLHAQARHRAAQAAEKKRRRELQLLAQQEPKLWAQAERLIEQKKASLYDQVVKLLKKLRLLADHQGRFADFQNRLADWKTRYPSLRAFWSRVDSAKLLSSEPLAPPDLSEPVEEDRF